ncbi:Protein of unknown function DUF2905 [Desulfovibrio sp. X2]|uniref:DUF2905 domain-containing protein n=1 Tax=Desulfovibrio sp. X2 TaxID=941449 RepID=UPI0003587530|nr:DUF2905 domain-containing protein [Desulfovibrio sp. X2]EPR38686.1 Protein of unknown function DUF2905 [Desulfovibrio sp. X2]
MDRLGKVLIAGGLVLAAVGLAVLLWDRLPPDSLLRRLAPGRLPGDIVIRRGGFTLYLPIGTCIAVSIVLTLLYRLFRK